VEIRTGAEPVLRHNRVHDGKAGGVFIRENGKGTLEDNDIFANARTGSRSKRAPIRPPPQSYIEKQASRSLGSRGSGGTFEGNDLRGNEDRRGASPRQHEPHRKAGNIEA